MADRERPGGPAKPTRAGDGGFWCPLCPTHAKTAAEIYAHAEDRHPYSNLALDGLRTEALAARTALSELQAALDAEKRDHAHTLGALARARVEIDRLRAEKRADGEVIAGQATALQAAAEEIVKLRGFWGACSAHRDVLLAENRVLRDRLARAHAQCALPATQPDTERRSAPQTEEPSS